MGTEIQTEQIVRDLKAVAQDAEELIKATAGELSERARAARERLTPALETAKRTCQRWEDQAIRRAKVADQAVHEHPYPPIAMAFGLGVVLGVLLAGK